MLQTIRPEKISIDDLTNQAVASGENKAEFSETVLRSINSPLARPAIALTALLALLLPASIGGCPMGEAVPHQEPNYPSFNPQSYLVKPGEHAVLSTDLLVYQNLANQDARVNVRVVSSPLNNVDPAFDASFITVGYIEDAQVKAFKELDPALGKVALTGIPSSTLFVAYGLPENANGTNRVEVYASGTVLQSPVHSTFYVTADFDAASVVTPLVEFLGLGEPDCNPCQQPTPNEDNNGNGNNGQNGNSGNDDPCIVYKNLTPAQVNVTGMNGGPIADVRTDGADNFWYSGSNVPGTDQVRINVTDPGLTGVTIDFFSVDYDDKGVPKNKEPITIGDADTLVSLVKVDESYAGAQGQIADNQVQEPFYQQGDTRRVAFKLTGSGLDDMNVLATVTALQPDGNQATMDVYFDR